MESNSEFTWSVAVKSVIKFSAAISLAGLTITFGMVASTLITGAAIQVEGNSALFSQLFSILRMTISLGGLFFLGAFCALISYLFYNYKPSGKIWVISYGIFLLASVYINFSVIWIILDGVKDLQEYFRTVGKVTVIKAPDLQPPFLDFLLSYLNPATQNPVVTFSLVMIISFMIIALLARRDIIAFKESRTKRVSSSN